MATAVAPPTRTTKTTSVDPMYTQALAQAKAALAAQQAPVQAQQAASDTYYQQRQTDAAANARALSELLKGIAPATQGIYENAAQNQELAANGFSQGMQDALKGNADNLNSMLEKLGSPATIDSHAREAGDVLYGLGGYQPGATFRREGAAFGAAAAQLPATALLRGQETYKQLGIEGDKAHADFDSRLAELAGKLPGDAQDNYSKLQALALSNKKFAFAVKKEKFDEAYKIAQQKIDVGYKNASLQLRGQALQLSAQKFARQQFQQDREYALSMARLGISQKSLQLRIAQQEFKLANGGFTSSQLARYNGYLQSIANSVHEVTAPDGSMHWLIPKNKAEAAAGKATLPIRYTDFLKQAVAKGVPISLAIERANTIFPETDRPTPQELAGATGLSQMAAAAATDYAGQLGDYNQTVGVGRNGKTLLGTGPNGEQVTLQVSGRLTAGAKTMLQVAVEYLGTPYAWGGGGPGGPSKGFGRGANTVGFDCSSFAQFLYSKVGITIPRTTFEQYKGGLSVPKGQLQPGDLVFFRGADSQGGLPGHVGVYVGGGNMIDAPHTGDVVRVQSIRRSDYVGARRYVH